MHSVIMACTITTLITTYIYIASFKVQLSQQLHCSVSYRWGYLNSLLYTPTLLLCLSACISLRLSFPFISCRNRWTMDRLRSMPRLSLKMSGRSLGSRLGLSTPVGSNCGQTTVALIWVWVYRVAQICRTILCNFK